MLYMASDNKKRIYVKIVLLFVLVYLIFLIFDNYQQHHQQNQLDKIKGNNIEALIFGGSNALNSLSARQLTHAVGMRYHNASMHNELGSNKSYNNYILHAAKLVDKNNIKEVVYSSILPFSSNSIKNHVKGDSNLSPKIIPYVSGMSYLKNFFSNRFEKIGGASYAENQDELVFNSFGDFTNPEKNCFYDEYRNNFKPESIENSVNFLIEKSYLLATNFPNSKIYITLPSLYYSSPVPKFSIFTTDLKRSFNKNLFILYPEIASRVTLIIQPLYPKLDFVCNDPIHATSLGREWRTKNLLSIIQGNAE
jgi:hypothetical protein